MTMERAGAQLALEKLFPTATTEQLQGVTAPEQLEKRLVWEKPKPLLEKAESPPQQPEEVQRIKDDMWRTIEIPDILAKSFGAAVTAPFRGGVPVTAESIDAAIQSVMPGGEVYDSYQKWQGLPVEFGWNVPEWFKENFPEYVSSNGKLRIDLGKEALEFIPWILLGGGARKSITQIAEQITAKQLAGKKLKDAEKRILAKAAEFEVKANARIIERQTAKVTEEAAGLLSPETLKVATPLIEPSGVMSNLRPINDAITTALQPDNMRKLANIPAFKWVAERISGKSATASTPVDQAMVGLRNLQQEAHTKVLSTMSGLERLGTQEQVFGRIGADGAFESGAIKGVLQNDLYTYPQKYWQKLTANQRQYIDEARNIEASITEYLERNGIKVEKLTFDEGGEYASQRVYAKFSPEGELVDYGFIGAGGGKPGTKIASEKARVFKDAAEAAKLGFRYVPRETALYLRAQGAYNRVMMQDYANWIIDRVATRTTEAFSLVKANKILNKALKKEPITQAQIDFLKRDMKEIGARFEQTLQNDNWEERYAALKGLRQELMDFVPTSKEQLAFAVEKLQARRETLQNAINVLQRASRGETIPTGTVKSIAKVLPEIKDKLKDATRVTLEDLIRGGQEAAKYPKELQVPNPGVLNKYKNLLKKATEALSADTNNTQLASQVRKLKRQYGFAKYRFSLGKPYEFSKSPVSILVGEDKKAFKELLEVIRGAPYEIVTATGKKAVKFKGGALKEARIKELEAKSIRAKLRETELRPKFGEATVPYPAFKGRIFTGEEAKETAKRIIEEIEPRYSRFLTALNKTNAVGRIVALGLDASVFLIQLLFLGGYNPKVWGKAGIGFVRGMFDPAYPAKFLSRHAATIAKSPGLVLTRGGATELTEALGAQGLLQKGILNPLGYIAKPFQRGFESALDTSGIYLKEALMPLVKDDITNAQVDAFVNKFRGLMATRTLGLGHFQQQLEPAVSLAPQYTRAIASILTDLARGNIRGKLARESLAKGTTAVVAASVAVSLLLGENFDEMLEHFDPTSPRFLTWLIAGQYVGPGSKVRTIVKLLADSAKNPDDLLKLSMQNPGLRFLRGMSSPTVSTGIDILTGKNYLGDPTRENMLQLTKTVVAENMVPLWMQSLALEGGNVQQRLLGAAEQFSGLRQYPITPRGLPQYMEDYFNAHPTSDVNLDNLIQGYKKDRDLFAEYDKLTGKARQLYREEHPQIEAMLYFWGKINSISDKAKPYLDQIKMYYDVGDDMVESREKAWEDTTKGGLTGTRKKTQEEIFQDFVDELPMFAAEYVWQHRLNYENRVDAKMMKLIDEMNMTDNQLVEQYYSATADMKSPDKEKYRARFPEIDVALNMRGRASVFQSSAALKLFKSRLRELGLPDDIAEKKVDNAGKRTINKPINVGGGLLQKANP